MQMKKNGFKQVWIILILIMVIIGAIFFSENQSKKQQIISQVINAKRNTITRKQVISGNIFPVKEIEVKSVIPGVLETYYVRTGGASVFSRKLDGKFDSFRRIFLNCRIFLILVRDRKSTRLNSSH